MGEKLKLPFKEWYAERAKKLKLDPNPDHPDHHYDYRAAYEAGAEPDEQGHWPSQFKSDDHPNRFVNGKDTKVQWPVAPGGMASRTTSPAAPTPSATRKADPGGWPSSPGGMASSVLPEPYTVGPSQREQDAKKSSAPWQDAQGLRGMRPSSKPSFGALEYEPDPAYDEPTIKRNLTPEQEERGMIAGWRSHIAKAKGTYADAMNLRMDQMVQAYQAETAGRTAPSVPTEGHERPEVIDVDVMTGTPYVAGDKGPIVFSEHPWFKQRTQVLNDNAEEGEYLTPAEAQTHYANLLKGVGTSYARTQQVLRNRQMDWAKNKHDDWITNIGFEVADFVTGVGRGMGKAYDVVNQGILGSDNEHPFSTANAEDLYRWANPEKSHLFARGDLYKANQEWKGKSGWRRFVTGGAHLGMALFPLGRLHQGLQRGMTMGRNANFMRMGAMSDGVIGMTSGALAGQIYGTATHPVLDPFTGQRYSIGDQFKGGTGTALFMGLAPGAGNLVRSVFGKIGAPVEGALLKKYKWHFFRSEFAAEALGWGLTDLGLQQIDGHLMGHDDGRTKKWGPFFINGERLLHSVAFGGFFGIAAGAKRARSHARGYVLGNEMHRSDYNIFLKAHGVPRAKRRELLSNVFRNKGKKLTREEAVLAIDKALVEGGWGFEDPGKGGQRRIPLEELISEGRLKYYEERLAHHLKRGRNDQEARRRAALDLAKMPRRKVVDKDGVEHIEEGYDPDLYDHPERTEAPDAMRHAIREGMSPFRTHRYPDGTQVVIALDSDGRVRRLEYTERMLKIEDAWERGDADAMLDLMGAEEPGQFLRAVEEFAAGRESDIDEHVQAMYPATQEPAWMDMYKAILRITSRKADPVTAIAIAESIFYQFQRTLKISERAPDGKAWGKSIDPKELRELQRQWENAPGDSFEARVDALADVRPEEAPVAKVAREEQLHDQEPDLTTEDMQAQFPTGKVTERPYGWKVEHEGVEPLRIWRKDSIEPTEEGLAEHGMTLDEFHALRAEGKVRGISGSFGVVDGQAIIQLASGLADRGSLSHETLHAAFKAVLTQGERDVLLRAHGSEEGAAEAFGNGTMKPESRTLVQKVIDYFRNLATKLGFMKPTARGIMGDIRSGRVWTAERARRPYDPPGTEGVIESSVRNQLRFFSDGKDIDVPQVTSALANGRRINKRARESLEKKMRAAGMPEPRIKEALKFVDDYNGIRKLGRVVMLPPIDTGDVVVREGVLNTSATKGQRRERVDKLYEGFPEADQKGKTRVEVGSLMEGGRDTAMVPKVARGRTPRPFLNLPVTAPDLQRPRPAGLDYPVLVTGNPHMTNFKRPHKSWDKSIKTVRVKPVHNGNERVTKAVVEAIEYANEIGASVLITTFRSKSPWALALLLKDGAIPTNPKDPEFAMLWKRNRSPKPTSPLQAKDWAPYEPRISYKGGVRNNLVGNVFRTVGWGLGKDVYGHGGTWWWPTSKALDPAIREALGKEQKVEYCDLLNKGCPACRNCQKTVYPEAAGAPLIGVTDEPFCEHGCPQCFVRIGQSGIGGRKGIATETNTKQRGFGEADIGDTYHNTINILQGVVRPIGAQDKVDYVARFMREEPGQRMDMAMSMFIDGMIDVKQMSVIQTEVLAEAGRGQKHEIKHTPDEGSLRALSRTAPTMTARDFITKRHEYEAKWILPNGRIVALDIDKGMDAGHQEMAVEAIHYSGNRELQGKYEGARTAADVRATDPIRLVAEATGAVRIEMPFATTRKPKADGPASGRLVVEQGAPLTDAQRETLKLLARQRDISEVDYEHERGKYEVYDFNLRDRGRFMRDLPKYEVKRTPEGEKLVEAALAKREAVDDDARTAWLMPDGTMRALNATHHGNDARALWKEAGLVPPNVYVAKRLLDETGIVRVTGMLGKWKEGSVNFQVGETHALTAAQRRTIQRAARGAKSVMMESFKGDPIPWRDYQMPHERGKLARDLPKYEIKVNSGDRATLEMRLGMLEEYAKAGERVIDGVRADDRLDNERGNLEVDLDRLGVLDQNRFYAEEYGYSMEQRIRGLLTGYHHVKRLEVKWSKRDKDDLREQLKNLVTLDTASEARIRMLEREGALDPVGDGMEIAEDSIRAVLRRAGVDEKSLTGDEILDAAHGMRLDDPVEDLLSRLPDHDQRLEIKRKEGEGAREEVLPDDDARPPLDLDGGLGGSAVEVGKRRAAYYKKFGKGTADHDLNPKQLNSGTPITPMSFFAGIRGLVKVATSPFRIGDFFTRLNPKQGGLGRGIGWVYKKIRASLPRVQAADAAVRTVMKENITDPIMASREVVHTFADAGRKSDVAAYLSQHAMREFSIGPNGKKLKKAERERVDEAVSGWFSGSVTEAELVERVGPRAAKAARFFREIITRNQHRTVKLRGMSGETLTKWTGEDGMSSWLTRLYESHENQAAFGLLDHIAAWWKNEPPPDEMARAMRTAGMGVDKVHPRREGYWVVWMEGARKRWEWFSTPGPAEALRAQLQEGERQRAFPVGDINYVKAEDGSYVVSWREGRGEDRHTYEEPAATLDAARTHVQELTAQRDKATLRLPSGDRKGKVRGVQIIEPLAKATREAMGEIKDVRVLIARSMMMQAQMNAHLEAFQNLATSKLHARAADAEDIPRGWVQMPDGKTGNRYGALKGMYVRKGLRKFLTGEFGPKGGAIWEGIAAFMDGMLTQWKIGKTVANPATQVRNFIGNIGFMTMDGMSYANVGQWPYFARALRIMAAQNPRSAEGQLKMDAIQLGVLGTEGLRHELQALVTRIESMTGATFHDKFVNFLKRRVPLATKESRHKIGHLRLTEAVSDLTGLSALYQFSDALPKMASLMRNLDQGMGIEDAAHQVRQRYPTYDTAWTKRFTAGRKGFKWRHSFLPFVADPFITFKSEAARIGAYWSTRRPFSLYWIMRGTWAAGAEVANQMLGISDEDDRRIRHNAAPWERTGMYRLAIPGWSNAETGEIGLLDATYYQPGGQEMQALNAWITSSPLEQSELTGGDRTYSSPMNPFWALAAQHILNINFFTGGSVHHTDDPPKEKRRQLLRLWVNGLFPSLMPSLFGPGTGGYSWNKLEQARSQVPIDRYGEKRRDMTDTMLDVLLGFKKRIINPTEQMERRLHTIERKMLALARRAKTFAEDPRYEGRRDDLIDQQLGELLKLFRNYMYVGRFATEEAAAAITPEMMMKYGPWVDRMWSKHTGSNVMGEPTRGNVRSPEQVKRAAEESRSSLSRQTGMGALVDPKTGVRMKPKSPFGGIAGRVRSKR